MTSGLNRAIMEDATKQTRGFMSKKIYASLNLDALADKMQEEICRCWKQAKNPFFSPLVIFSDNKMEQWFKLRWLKKNAGTNFTLMNLKTAGVENFLFDIASPKARGERYKRLPPELLRDIVASKLGSSQYAESLPSKEVAEYLFDNEDGKKVVNQIRLYDFSKEISALLIDYEVTRSEEIKKPEFWEAAPWQKKLYDDIFGPGGSLETIFSGQEKFVTICALAQKNAELNGGKIHFNWNPARPVFIFGFCGMGQYYRTLLNKFSESADLYVFLQTPPNESADKNPLVKKWVAFGRCNLNLWDDKNAGAAEVCAELDFIKQKLDGDINRQGFLSLTAAPSRLREIEAVHSKICALLKNGARLGDILVLAPAVQEYKVAVEQNFDQNTQADKDFPCIPYMFADSSSKSSLAAQALGVIFEILQKGYFSRSDLFSLLRNKLVQAARGIDGQEVGAWADWAAELNVYRDRDGVDDWDKAKARLLLSRLADGAVSCGENQYLPYETIDSADDSCLCDFVQAVDELKELLCAAGKSADGFLDLEQVDKFKEIIEKWLLPGDEDAENDPDLLCEKYVFNSVVSEIECQKIIAGEGGKINRDILAFSLFDSIAASEFSRGTILSGGVTFADFKPNRILSAKYIFFLGCDSKTLPGLDRSSVLDLRARDIAKGDDSIPARCKNAFLCQLAAAREGFYISYVNKNLKKDEDFYKSSLAEELPVEKLEVELGIDEDRPWSELWTKRAFRNKRSFEALKNKSAESVAAQGAADIPQAQDSAAKNFPERVSISKMKKFLEDPFVFMTENLFSNEDDNSETERQEFEPIDFDRLTSSILRKEYIKGIDDKEFLQELKNENLLPDSFFGEQALEKIRSDCNAIKDAINDDAALTGILGKLKFDASANLLMRQEIGGKEKEWILSGSLAWFNADFLETKKIVTLELNNSNNCLGGYISALALLASLEPGGQDKYEVCMNVVKCKDGAGIVEEPKILGGVTRERALRLLQKIYEAMYVERYKKCVPYKLLCDKKFNPTKLSQLYDKLLGYNGLWQYFSKAVLFDIWTDIGFTEDGFEFEWKEAAEHQVRLMEFLLNDGESGEA